MNTTSRRRTALAGLVGLALVAAACGSSSKSATTTAAGTATTAAGATTTAGGAATTAAASTTAGGSATTEAPATTAGGTPASSVDPSSLKAELNGSGSTFVKNFLEEAIAGFTESAKGVTINYAGGGSGKGRQDLADQVVDFAGTDGTIKDADLAGYKGGDVLYFPVVVAPITVSYNLDVKDLKLSPTTIAKIFQLEIKNWNDPAIAAENPDAKLPDQAITVVHRSDSSGTTGNFTKFLEKSVGKDNGGIWKLGTDSTVQWDANTQAGQGNSGVAQIISGTKGAIGYVDYADAIDAKLTFAQVQNKAGKFVAATIDGASAAAAGAKVADNLTFSAIWADGDAAYPITAQTWIIAYAKQGDAAKGAALKAFLQYALTEGQKVAADVNYAPLPADLAAKALDQLAKLGS